MATIQGPAAATQSGAPPTFQVDPSPNQFYAYEVATDAALFAAVERGTERTPANFYASWQAPRLTAAPTVQLPTTVWQRFAQANRLYYRVWTSAAETEWVNALTTTADAEAHRAPFVQLVSLLLGGVLTPSQVPLEEIWSVATGQETIGTVTAAGECQAAIGWHMFSPKRPIAPQAAEWVVIVTTQPTQPDAPIATGMVRLAPQTLEVKATQHFQDPPAPVDERELLARVNRADNSVWQIHTDQPARAGDLWVAAELRPPPTQSGGTVIVQARTGRILYQATTPAQGRGEVLVP